MSIRDDIRVLYAEHDRFMAEQASEPIRRPTVSETDDAGLIYKEYDNSAPAPAPVADADWSEWERWLRGHLDIARAELLDTVSRALGEIVARERAEARKERDTELLKLRAELAELKGRVDTLLSLVTKGGDVVDLPQASWRRDRDRA